MGTQQVLRTGRTVVAIVAWATSATAAAAPTPERVAVIDLTAHSVPGSGAHAGAASIIDRTPHSLRGSAAHAGAAGAIVATPTTAVAGNHGPNDSPASNASIRAALTQALASAGLEPIAGDGVEYALAGVVADRDATTLDVALADAERSFRQLACFEVNVAAQRALRVLAARQASGIAVPELPRAWTYLLQCADRTGDVDGAMRAAEGIRSATPGDLPAFVPRELLTNYPAVDAVLGVDRYEVDIAADDGAVVWVDFQPVGTAPLRVAMPAGDHIVAAAKGARRGSAVVNGAPNAAVSVELVDQRSPWGAVATTIASWRGKSPTAKDLGSVLDQVGARIAVVRRGDTLQAWGRAGALETPRQLGGQAGTRPIAQADRVAALVVDEVAEFAARTPDPNLPLLVDNAARTRHHKAGDEPTKWWVYAAIGASIAAGALVIYAYRADSSTTHLELRHP